MRTQVNASRCYLHIRRGRHIVRIPRTEVRELLATIGNLDWRTGQRYLQELHDECAVYVDAAARIAGVSPYAVWHARSQRQTRARRIAWRFICDESVADYQHDVAEVFGVRVHTVNRGIAQAREDITEEEHSAMVRELEQYTAAAE